MLILFEKNKKIENYLRRYLSARNVFAGVVADLEYCLTDSQTGEKGLFEEINNLAGPIILHGGRQSPDGKIILIAKPIGLAKREDAIWVEKICSDEFFRLYWKLFMDIFLKKCNVKLAH